MGEIVVDTNVWAVADERHERASLECAEACQDLLRTLRSDQVLAVDDDYAVLREYRRNIDPSGFAAKLLNHLQQRGPLHFVALTQDEDDEIFSPGGALESFDVSDRKFVLVALESQPRRPIFDAVDPDWSAHAEGLATLAIPVHELCPCDLENLA